MTAPNDKRALPFGGSFAVMDPNTSAHLPEFEDTPDFCSEFLEWIKSTKLNKISGIKEFNCLAYSNGTTESFDKFYMKNHNKRFRCFKGEYVYHQVAWRNHFVWAFIEDTPLAEGDAVVISLPFANTGNEHEQMQSILEICTQLNIPVLLDCAYFGICSNITFDFNHPCITDIVFSLSKTFPVAYVRIGMRLTRVDDDDTLLMYNKISYTNRIGSRLGSLMIKDFSPDYIVEKYKNKQLKFCNHLGIEPSNTVLFGIDRSNKYPEYNRGGITNRLSLHKYLIKDSSVFYNENSTD
jgi:hypothetical protein